MAHAGGDLAAERALQLGPGRELARRRSGGRGVDDVEAVSRRRSRRVRPSPPRNDARSRRACRPRRRARSAVLRERGQRGRVALDARGQCLLLVAGVTRLPAGPRGRRARTASARGSREQTTAHGTRSPGGTRRRGRSRSATGRRACGEAPRRGRRSSSSARTSACPRRSRACCWRVTTAPGSTASATSTSNSLGVSAISPPSEVAPGARVDLERAEQRGAQRLATAGGPPRHGTDPREQLAEPERLDEVVVRAQLEADDAVDLLAARRDDDDRHVRRGAQAPADLEAVESGRRRSSRTSS